MEIKDKGEIRAYSMNLHRWIKCIHCGKINDLKDIFGSPERRVDFNEKNEFRIKCMGCNEWFMPESKGQREIIEEIYLFQNCSCGYSFDFRYPADKKRLRLIPIFNIPFAVCPECDHVLIFSPEKGIWRFWILATYLKLWIFFKDIIDWLIISRK